MATPEIPVSDDELDSLMAELEDATGVPAASPAPKPKAAPTPTPEPELSADDLEGLDLEPDPVAPAVVATPEPIDELIVLEDDDATIVIPSSTPAALTTVGPNVDDELAALEAEIESGTVAPPTTAPWEEPVVALEPDPVAIAPVVEPEPVAAAPVPTLAPAPVTKVSIEEEEAASAVKAKKAAAALDYYIDVDKFKADMQVTENNLDDCMMQQASLRAFYGARAARAEAQASSIKARFEVREAKIFDEHRKAMVASGEKVTEKAIENLVKMDPRWVAGKLLVVEAESIAAVAKSCVFALSDRRDMIIQLGADRRDESKGQVRIMAAQAERENLANRAVNAARVANG
jgi:hypothetical protein